MTLPVEQPTPEATDPAAAADWLPDGYYPSPDDPNVAYRWDDDPQCAEYEQGWCWGVYVVSRKGCLEDVYVEANIFSGGTVIGYTNATVGSLEPDQRARLTLSNTTDADDVEATLTKIACY